MISTLSPIRSLFHRILVKIIFWKIFSYWDLGKKSYWDVSPVIYNQVADSADPNAAKNFDRYSIIKLKNTSNEKHFLVKAAAGISEWERAENLDTKF